MVPPVAPNFGATPTLVPSLALPTALNCLLAPTVSDVLSGLRTMRVTSGLDAVTVTTAVSATPFVAVAITENIPASAPATYLPVASTVPPLAVQVTSGTTVLPDEVWPATLNVYAFPGTSRTESGVTDILTGRRLGP